MNFRHLLGCDTIELCDLDYVWNDPDKIDKIENSSLITKCFNSLIERYINFWQDCINNNESCCPDRLQSNGGHKLRTYNLGLKFDYKMESYQYFIGDREIRRNLAKLSCSNHSLLIESGRYLKLEIVDRICKSCKRCNRVEDETHFLLNAAYILSRDRNFTKIIIFLLTVNQKKHS